VSCSIETPLTFRKMDVFDPPSAGYVTMAVISPPASAVAPEVGQQPRPVDGRDGHAGAALVRARNEGEDAEDVGLGDDAKD
jgi:hypothetical protein